MPHGHYGARTVTIWDRGELVIENLRENEKILFELSGNKMQGRYALIKTGFWGRRRVQAGTGCCLSGNNSF